MTDSIHAQPRFIGKRTAKGLVVREITCGVMVGQWFVRMNADDCITRDPARMTDHGFRPCMGQAEVDRVSFFARRWSQA